MGWRPEIGSEVAAAVATSLGEGVGDSGVWRGGREAITQPEVENVAWKHTSGSVQ